MQTKDRAQEILQIREANVKKQEQKSQQALQREQETRSVHKKQHFLKKESVVKKKHAAIQVISKKYQDVELVKSESRRLKAERERLQLEEVERAKEKRESIRRQEDALKRKKQSERHAQDQGVALRLMKKAIDEERKIREHQRRVEEMEQTELELIQRLQGTQLIQREAYTVLEHALLRSDARKLTQQQPFLSSAGMHGAQRGSTSASILPHPHPHYHSDGFRMDSSPTLDRRYQG